jgi:hypothetical protein
MLSGPSTNQPAHGHFRPVGQPSQPSHPAATYRTRPVSLTGGTRARVSQAGGDASASSPTFCLWLTPKGKGGGGGGALAAPSPPRRAARPGASRPPTCPCRAAPFKPPPSPAGSPKP